METFADRLANQMAKKKINQNTLSSLAGVGQGTISKYLNGQDPKSAELFRISVALDVTMDYLYSGRNKPVGIEKNPRAEFAENKIDTIKVELEALLVKLSAK